MCTGTYKAVKTEIEAVVAKGTIYQEILSYAEQFEADIIIMGSHRRKLSDYLIGPNATKVIRHTNCSTLVVRE